MGIQRSQEDSWTKEMAKWEQRPVLVNGTYVEPIPFAEGGRGGAPRAEYPKALYRAESADGGPRICADPRLVHDEAQERIAVGQGWFADQNDAIKAVFAHQHEIATLAANREYHDRRMSEKARAEATRIDESTMAHLPVIPETPIRRRGGRPRKQSGTAAAVEG